MGTLNTGGRRNRHGNPRHRWEEEQTWQPQTQVGEGKDLATAPHAAGGAISAQQLLSSPAAFVCGSVQPELQSLVAERLQQCGRVWALTLARFQPPKPPHKHCPLLRSRMYTAKANTAPAHMQTLL
uniref:Uncharacterized protein n=1 Tax=Knipowitschia caucasica TaxID=637954 RepID=A0AAV2MIH5_KNICA